MVFKWLIKGMVVGVLVIMLVFVKDIEVIKVVSFIIIDGVVSEVVW